MSALPFRFYAWVAWTAGIGVLIYSGQPIVAIVLTLCGPYTLTALEEFGR